MLVINCGQILFKYKQCRTDHPDYKPSKRSNPAQWDYMLLPPRSKANILKSLLKNQEIKSRCSGDTSALYEKKRKHFSQGKAFILYATYQS